MREFLAIASALADENRTRTLLFLRRGEMCVCQIVEMLALAPSTVSKHLWILQQAGLVQSRKEGRWIYYRLPDSPAPCAGEALCWLGAALGRDERASADARRAKDVIRMDKGELCCRYKKAAQPARRSAGGKPR
jgi:ArsR family transcriptional regulator, arsenate/arsenite/antimonite-responsive transcriptional repressor